jgi:hypothetical protein
LFAGAMKEVLFEGPRTVKSRSTHHGVRQRTVTLVVQRDGYRRGPSVPRTDGRPIDVPDVHGSTADDEGMGAEQILQRRFGHRLRLLLDQYLEQAERLCRQ